MRWILLALLCLGLPAQAEPNSIRAMWVTQKYLESPQSVSKIIKTAQRMHMNTLFVQVRARGSVSYRSRLEPPAFDIKKYPDFDPLQEILKQAKPLGIAVHAWVNVFYVWSDKKPPQNPQHVLNRQPGWVLQPNGQVFLNPSNLDVQNYSTELIHEIAMNYRVDGIHLDYFRYPSPVKNAEWREARERNLHQFLRRLWDWKASRYAGLKLSVAVVSDYPKAISQYSQNWKEWVHGGIVDWIVPMAYQKNSKKFKNEIIWANQTAALTPVKVVAGVGMWQLDTHHFAEQLQIAKNLQQNSSPNALVGVSLFSYEKFSYGRQSVWLQKLN